MKAVQLIAFCCGMILLNGCSSHRQVVNTSKTSRSGAHQLSDEERQLRSLQADISAKFSEMEILNRMKLKLRDEFEVGSLYSHASIKALVADGENRKKSILSNQAYLEALEAFDFVTSNRVQALKAEYDFYKEESGCHLGGHSIKHDSKR